MARTIRSEQTNALDLYLASIKTNLAILNEQADLLAAVVVEAQEDMRSIHPEPGGRVPGAS
jgi:hypothetical protein